MRKPQSFPHLKHVVLITEISPKVIGWIAMKNLYRKVSSLQYAVICPGENLLLKQTAMEENAA